MLPGQIRHKSLPDLMRDIDPGVGPGPRNDEVMVRTVRIVDLLLRFPPLLRYGRCLLRSLTLFKFLRRQGWPVEIHFGVKKTDDESPDITGHSWLVLEGDFFLESESQQDSFKTTYYYPR